MMRLKRFIAISFFAMRFAGAQNVQIPVAGIVLDQAGRLIAVHGVFGTLLRGEPIALPTDLAAIPVSASFSDTSGLLKSAVAYVITDGTGQQKSSIPTPEKGPAMASFAADGSLEWFCAGACTTLQNPQSAAVSTANAAGVVVALGIAAGQSVPLLTQSGTQLWSCLLNAADQSTGSQLPISGGLPAAALNAGWLTTSANGLIWTAPNGITTTIPVPEPVLTLQSSGSRSVCINGRWMLNTALQVLEIPVKTNRVTKPQTNPVMVTR